VSASGTRRRVAAALCGGLLAAAALPAHAAKLPDWADAIARTAPAPPDTRSKDTSLVLLSETHVTVLPDGRVRTRQRTAEQAWTSRAEDVGLGGFPFDKKTKLRTARAWHLPPGEKVEKSSGFSEITLSLDSASFLSDNKTRIIGMDGVKKGSIVFFEFEAEEAKPTPGLYHLVYTGAPTRLSVFEIELPSGWSQRSDWLRSEGPQPVTSGATTRWELRDMPGPITEPLGDDPRETAPALAVALVPPPIDNLKSVTAAEWKDVSVWYDRITKGMDAASPAVTAAANGALAGKAGFWDQVAAAARHVRDRVRYVAIELGDGGYVPRPAGDTLGNLYGDCKDKGTLFRSFLATRGIASWGVLVNATTPDTLSDTAPSWAFNHFIVAVPVPAGETVPETYAGAVVDGGDLGRLLFVDTTSESTPPGAIPSNLAGHKALVVAADRGRLVTLPPGRPEDNRLVRRAKGEVAADRSVTWTFEDQSRGAIANWSRSLWRHSASDYRKGRESAAAEAWPGARLTKCDVVDETDDGAFNETRVVAVPQAAHADPESALRFFPSAEDWLPRVSLSRRTVPVVYVYPRILEYETRLTGLPATAALPTAKTWSGDGWEVGTEFRREDSGGITARWKLVLTRTRYAPDAFPELKKLWSAIGTTAAPMIPLPPAS